MCKEEELKEIQKWKLCTLEEVHELEDEFAACVSFSF